MRGIHSSLPVLLIILFALNIACSKSGGLFDNRKELALRNMDRIERELNAYYDKFGVYPDNLDVLREKGFISRFPMNPYSDDKSQLKQVRMDEPSPGDFTYLKIYHDRFSDEIMYYVLILWGPENYKNEDIFDASYDYEIAHLTTWYNMPDGKPDHYLKIIKSELRMKPDSPPEE